MAAVNIAIVTDINEGFNLKLNTLLNVSMANAENGGAIKWEQDFYESSGNCFDYDCLNGQEYENICTCDVEQAMCPSGSIDNCFVTGVSQVGEPYDCSPNGWTGNSCW